jgi:REP element-mobilizing transposase RayT
MQYWHGAIGFLYTFSTYGTWLHGDERGSVDRKQQHKRLGPDPKLHRLRQDQLKYAPLKLDAAMRKVVREAIEDYCKFKGWDLQEINVRTNHVHCVILTDVDSGKVLNGIKARATRLLREAKLVHESRPVWTEGGNRRMIKTEEDLTNAAHYVRERQGADLPEE